MIDTRNNVYMYQGSRHDLALRQFSIVTQDDGKPFEQDGVEETQALIFDPEYIEREKMPTGGAGFFIVQLERAIRVEETPYAIGHMQLSRKIVKRGEWKASDKKKWKHTLDVLRRDHDEEVIMPAAHEEVIEDLIPMSAKQSARGEKRADAPHSSESSDQPVEKSIRVVDSEMKN